MVRVRTDTKVVALSDLHAPHQDEAALSIALDFIKDFKPDIVIALGDWIDGYHASSYGADITSHDQLDEFEIGNDLLDRFKPDIFMEGNHEQRFFRTNIPQGYRRLLDPKRWLNISERGIKWIPYRNDPSGIYRLGKLSFHHGFGFSQNVSRKNAQLFGSLVFGHTHRIQEIQHPHISEQMIGYSIGCLCDKYHGYAATRDPHGWAHGFGYGYVYEKSGNFTFNIARLDNNRVHIEGREYSRS